MVDDRQGFEPEGEATYTGGTRATSMKEQQSSLSGGELNLTSAPHKGTIKVLLVHDQALFREGIARILAVEEGIKVVGEAQNRSEAVALAEREEPEVVLLGVEMHPMAAEGAIGRILCASPSSKVIVLAMYDEPRLLRRLLALGAHAYLGKNASRDELLAAVHSVRWVEDRVGLGVSRSTADRLKGSEKGILSVRELEILLLVARAMSSAQIASRLYISVGTVKHHLTNIYAKLGVSSREEAVNEALRSGLVTLGDLSTYYI